MKQQLHRRFTDNHLKVLFDLYLKKALSANDVISQLGCSRSRFFDLLKRYRQDPKGFTVAYRRRQPHYRLSPEIDQIIREELEKDYQLIRNPATPITNYNYAYIRTQVVARSGKPISTQTVRNRAKDWGFYRAKRKRKEKISRVVTTEAVGMLLQHDSSHHKWSPYADKKWSLITTIEDHSRYLLYAELVDVETTWAHIQAIKSVALKYGIGQIYYVDRHSIFRYQHRNETVWRRRHQVEEALTQWRIVLEKCQMRVLYALSPEAKGKVERPYRWLQDHIVRTCAREKISTIDQAREVLKQEIKHYNEQLIHSTTGEIPVKRLKRAIQEGRNYFKTFQLPPHCKSLKDVFCLHQYRRVDGYNRITWQNKKIKIPVFVPQGSLIELHIIPHPDKKEIRIWCKNRVVKVIYYKT
ncbi:MAG TPA: hypothetical protein ENI34_10320 [candidate division WOR-3 bacterium]|uniref:Integrase catalytic domain-containing protein n=2 Tax=candidate division WOR-3 bacterium TaxID=2052148 RepID=A0A9C9K0V0_UNCW3|nr:hypothetical protein [candidate division WOR-3 bacterium]